MMNISRKIFIASDHAGFKLKQEILSLTKESLTDLGTNSEESVDYPDFANSLIKLVNKTNESFGILICGSGIGMAIAANRHPKIRAGVAFTPEIASLMRKHNNANVLVLPGRFINIHEALNCVDNFLKSQFETGRHQKRINKLEKNIYE